MFFKISPPGSPLSQWETKNISHLDSPIFAGRHDFTSSILDYVNKSYENDSSVHLAKYMFQMS